MQLALQIRHITGACTIAFLLCYLNSTPLYDRDDLLRTTPQRKNSHVVTAGRFI
ncbi:hypothetical protein NSMM_850024 [Nitrosomonas mobilis]|uniref:Uncharacterized protein n=1 Tax=Nitrosomonas mobilis TaxID=51642 RepID=A0A1G5SID7_9PROT|nr:hypothetical protein NSMM_850024 [Nitrosomonas mobilis]